MCERAGSADVLVVACRFPDCFSRQRPCLHDCLRRMASGCFRPAREILSGEILRDRARISGENMRFLGLLMVVLEAAPLFCRRAVLVCPHMISRGGQGGRSRERCCFCAVYRCRLPDVSGITVRFSGMPERMKTFGPPVSLRLTVCLAVDAGIIKRLNSLFFAVPGKNGCLPDGGKVRWH